MKHVFNFKSVLAAILFFISFTIQAQNVFYIYAYNAVGAEPWTWAPLPLNSEVMDSVFGLEGTGWTRGYFETIDPASVFNDSTCTVYLEGGDSHDLPLSNFLAANISMIESWVFNGGHLLICSAPNYFGPINCGFGGVQIIWPRYTWTASTVNPMHPIFQGPYDTFDNIFDGSYFAHAKLTGGTLIPLMVDTLDGDTVMAESTWGSGKLLFATITVPGWHQPPPEGFNLKANMLTYLACDICSPEIPTGLYADNITTTKAKLHWNAIDGVDKYKVFFYNTGGALVFKKSTANNSVTVKDLIPGTQYIFKVRSVCVGGDVSVFSTPSIFTTLMRMGELENDINLFPNPATSEVTISGTSGNDVNISIINAIGETIISKNITSMTGEINETIELTSMPAGIYFVTIESGEKIKVEKLIVE